MSELTSNEQTQFIFREMRDGMLLSNINGFAMSEVIGAIRSQTDEQRGRLIDDWLIAVVSKYSDEAYRMPAHFQACKLIMENCTKLAKSFGEESSSKKKTGNKSIYIRAVRTKASEAASASGASVSSLGPKVVGGHVDKQLQDQIDNEVRRQLGLPAKTEATQEPFIQMDDDGGKGEEVPTVETSATTVPVPEPAGVQADRDDTSTTKSPSTIPVMARRLLKSMPRDLLDDIPEFVAECDIDGLFEVLIVVGEIEPPTSEAEAIPYAMRTGEEFWTSTQKASKRSVAALVEALSIPASPTGIKSTNEITVDAAELKAIKRSRAEGPKTIELPIEDIASVPLVSVQPLSAVFNKPLPKEKPVKVVKPIEPALTKQEKAERRLEKRKLALALYKQERGE